MIAPASRTTSISIFFSLSVKAVRRADDNATQLAAPRPALEPHAKRGTMPEVPRYEKNSVDVVSQSIGPHAGGENRFRVTGPSVQLAPGAGLAISMALHELATNAAKYGALTSAEGHVDVVWKVEEENGNRRFVLKWVESGRPSVVKPTRRAFGSRLIERALAYELQGEVSLEYAPAGVRCTIVAPLEVGQQLVGNPST